MNIRLTQQAMERIYHFKKEFKERGLKARDWNQILSELIISANETDWTKKIEELTPSDYYLNQIQNDPDMKERIVKMYLKTRKAKSNPSDITENDLNS